MPIMYRVSILLLKYMCKFFGIILFTFFLWGTRPPTKSVSCSGLRQEISYVRNIQVIPIRQWKGLVETFLLSYNTYETDRFMITTIRHNCANWYIIPNGGNTGLILVPFVISLVRQILWMRHLNWITQEMTLCMWSLVLNFKKVVVFHVWVQLQKLVVIHTHVGTFYLMVLTHPIFETTTDIKYISKFVKYRQLLTSLATQSCTFWKYTISWGVQTSGSLTMIFLL